MIWKKIDTKDLAEHAEHLPLFHNPEWLYVLEQAYRFKGQYWLGEEHGVARVLLPLVQVKPHYGMSLPHLPHAGALSLPGYMPTAITWNVPPEMMKLQVRTLSAQPPQAGAYVMMKMPLLGYPHQLAARVQQQLVQQAAQFTWQSIKIDVFYEAYVRAMFAFGTPPHAAKFFKHIQLRFPDMLCSGLFSKDGQLAGAALELNEHDTRVGMWFFTLPNWRNTAGYALYHHVLTQAMHDGKKHYNLGRCKMGDGVYQFKKKMGAMPTAIEEMCYTAQKQIIMNPYQADWKQKIWKKMPLSVVRAVGPVLRKQIY